MGRSLRIDDPGSWHHVMNRGAAHQDIFYEARDRVEFEALLGLAHERFGIRVHGFCLMTNHYHLLLECPEAGLADAMHLIGSMYVRSVNARQGRDGPLFRDRYFAKPVTSNEYLTRLVRYIHRNPLAFCTVDELRSYRWSSLRIYLGRRRAPAWMTTATLLDMFGGVEKLDRYVTSPETVGGLGLDATGWHAAIQLAVDTHVDDRARNHAVRSVGALLLDRLEGSDLSAVAGMLSYPSAAAEKMARSRARRRVETSSALLQAADTAIALAA